MFINFVIKKIIFFIKHFISPVVANRRQIVGSTHAIPKMIVHLAIQSIARANHGNPKDKIYPHPVSAAVPDPGGLRPSGGDRAAHHGGGRPLRL